MKTAARVLVLSLLACAAPVPESIPPNALPDVAIGATLRIESPDARCTGVLVAPTVALSAAHCFTRSGSYRAIRDGHGASEIGRTLQVGTTDLDVVELLQPLPGPYATIAKAGAPVAFIVGYGCVRDRDDYMQLSARKLSFERDGGIESTYLGKACHGDSGGGIWDREGRLIGIVHLLIVGDRDKVVASDVL